MIYIIARKEFRSLLAMPSTWLLLAALQFILAWYFFVRLDAFLQVQAQLAQIANAPGATQAVAAPVAATVSLVMMMLVPLFTMRLIAEERRNQTLVMLMASPISSWQIVLGKFAGLLLFLLLIIASTLLMLLTLALGTQIDSGLLFGNMLGLLLLTASYTALGLYFSALTTQPIVAAAGSLAMLFGMWLIDMAAADSDMAWRNIMPGPHFQNINEGLLRSPDVLYFVLFTGFFLLLTIRRVHNNRIYGQ
jgi:ABC-2 type transport system permease protein